METTCFVCGVSWLAQEIIPIARMFPLSRIDGTVIDALRVLYENRMSDRVPFVYV